jgi:hypothetical protein
MTMEKPIFEVADIARAHGHQLIKSGKLIAQQKKVMSAITNCRTAELGGHKEKCTYSGCHFERFAYNGCRDRHCPKCNSLKREKWIADRKADALPVPYFHIVFTLPVSLESVCMKHGSEMYNLLFQTVWETICFFAKQHKYLGAKMGMVALLHTWGQNLMRHTHIHCLVPAGGIDAQGKWRMCKQEGKFFVHVKKLSKVFRGKFTDGLIKLQQQGIIELEDGPLVVNKKYLHPLYRKKWVVYTKAPLPTSDNVVEYIGRYSHRVAISNHRIKAFADGKVTFSWIDYRTSKPGLMPLDADHFLQRFLSHVLPTGFMKIRHYGILASRNKADCIQSVREEFNVVPMAKPTKGLNWIETFKLLYGRHPKLCPCCKKGIMMSISVIEPAYRIRQRDGPKLEANASFCKRQV